MNTITGAGRFVRFFAFALLLTLASEAPAAETYHVDPTHSTVVFRIKHLSVSYFFGRFNDVQGKFVLDADNPERGSIEITIKSDSIDTNNAERDKHMKGPEFFNAKQFPEIRFKSTKIRASGDRTYEVQGQFTMLDTTHPLTVQIKHVGEGQTFIGQRSGFYTSFSCCTHPACVARFSSVQSCRGVAFPRA